MGLSQQTIRQALARMGVATRPDLADQINAYISLLLQWNQKINLTTITSPEGILTRHFAESFFATTVAPVSEGRLADVGSGAGFPGLALKLIRPNLKVELIEPNLKKATFLAEVARKLGLRGVRVVRSRFQGISDSRYDYVACRALGFREELLKWAHAALQSGGCCILWLGMKDADAVRAMASPAWSWKEATLIPGSRERAILVGNPAGSRIRST